MQSRGDYGGALAVPGVAVRHADNSLEVVCERDSHGGMWEAESQGSLWCKGGELSWFKRQALGTGGMARGLGKVMQEMSGCRYPQMNGRASAEGS